MLVAQVYFYITRAVNDVWLILRESLIFWTSDLCVDVTKFVSENFMSRMKNSFKNTKRPKVEKRNNDNEEPAAEEIAPTEEVYILLFSITCSRVL